VSAADPAAQSAETLDRAGLGPRLPVDLLILLLMAVAGLGISIYLTTVHYANVPLVCSATGIVDCQQVTKSAYSMVGNTGIPITIPGMAWFVVSGALAGGAWYCRARGPALLPRLAVAHVVWGALGLAFVLYLVYAELVLLHKICEWCTVVHVLTLLTFLVALYRLPGVWWATSEDDTTLQG
jgi:uncharacterized membrane protein